MGNMTGNSNAMAVLGVQSSSFKSQSICVSSSGVIASLIINIHSFYSAVLGSSKCMAHEPSQLCRQKTPKWRFRNFAYVMASHECHFDYTFCIHFTVYTLFKNYSFRQYTVSTWFSNTLPCGFLRDSLFSSCACGWNLWRLETNTVWRVTSLQTTFTDEKPEANSLGDPWEFCCLEKFFDKGPWIKIHQNPITLVARWSFDMVRWCWVWQDFGGT